MEAITITVKEAAERMGIAQTTLREGLVRDKYPFGTGYKTNEGNKKRVFYINRNIFEKYLKGEFIPEENNAKENN